MRSLEQDYARWVGRLGFSLPSPARCCLHPSLRQQFPRVLLGESAHVQEQIGALAFIAAIGLVDEGAEAAQTAFVFEGGSPFVLVRIHVALHISFQILADSQKNLR